MHSLTDEQLLAIIRENPVNRALLAVLATLDIPTACWWQAPVPDLLEPPRRAACRLGHQGL